MVAHAHVSQVLLALESPRCARELREQLGLKRKTTESLLARMRRRGLVVCITPQARQSRVYTLTTLGRLQAYELGGRLHQSEHGDTGFWELYSWVQAGKFRRLALKHLDSSMTSRALRKRICREHVRIGANHVHGVLRDFQCRHVAERAGSLWGLTPLGVKLRDRTSGLVTQTASHRQLEAVHIPVLQPWVRVRPVARTSPRGSS